MRGIESAKPLDQNWPHLQANISSPIRAILAKRLFLASVRGLKLSLIMPNGDVFGEGRGEFRSGGDPALRIIDPGYFFSRVGRDGALGFGESYLFGAWTVGRGASITAAGTDEMEAWLEIYAASLRSKESQLLFRLRDLWHRSLPRSERNSESGALRNVQAHYDLDHQLFELFLDPSMTYSSAWYESGDNLWSAQKRKIDAALDLAQVSNGNHLLDIGSGFGGLAMRAANERGARVTGITLSEKQRRYSSQLAKDLGIDDRVIFLLEDYRQHSGLYHSIVCIEMIEAVGADYWMEFFSTVDRLLAPDGHFALQVITLPHEKMLASINDFSWIDRYIFPGGALPSLREIARILNDCTGLEIVQARRLSDSYGRTLREWRHAFLGAIEAVKKLGFDETFIRLWSFYFAYFEAGFRSRYCDVWQLGIKKIS